MSKKSMKVEINQLGDLEKWLQLNHLPLHEWNRNEAKSVTQLYEEIHKGECWLQPEPPLRVVSVVQVLVFQNNLLLVEIEQELSDQRSRKRCMPPSEKMKPGENWRTAARRCLVEELEVSQDQINLVSKTCKPIIRERFSLSYPGLKSQYHIYQVEAEVSDLPEKSFSTKENTETLTDQAINKHYWDWISPTELDL